MCLPCCYKISTAESKRHWKWHSVFWFLFQVFCAQLLVIFFFLFRLQLSYFVHFSVFAHNFSPLQVSSVVTAEKVFIIYFFYVYFVQQDLPTFVRMFVNECLRPNVNCHGIVRHTWCWKSLALFWTVQMRCKQKALIWRGAIDAVKLSLLELSIEHTYWKSTNLVSWKSCVHSLVKWQANSNMFLGWTFQANLMNKPE